MAWSRTNKRLVIFLCSPDQWCAADVDMSCWAFCDALIIFFGDTFWKILFVGPIPGRKSVGKYENEYAGVPTLLPYTIHVYEDLYLTTMACSAESVQQLLLIKSNSDVKTQVYYFTIGTTNVIVQTVVASHNIYS